MGRFGVVLDSLLCPVYEDANESHSHLFFECSLSKKVNDLIFEWMGFRAWPLEYHGWIAGLATKNTRIMDSVTFSTLR